MLLRRIPAGIAVGRRLRAGVHGVLIGGVAVGRRSLGGCRGGTLVRAATSLIGACAILSRIILAVAEDVRVGDEDEADQRYNYPEYAQQPLTPQRFDAADLD